MKIGLVSRVIYPLHGFGGMEKHVYYLAKGLAQKGVNVELFCKPTKKAIPNGLHHKNIKIHFVPSYESSSGGVNQAISHLSFVKNLINYESELNEMDVLHFQGVLSGAYYALVGGEKPKIFTTHGLEQFKHSAKYFLLPFNMLEILAARRASKIISLGPGNTGDIIKFLRVDKDLIEEIPNGVDTSFFEPKNTEKLREKHELSGKVVIGLSRLVKHKGFDLLIKAVDELSEEIDINLVIVGGGPDKERLKKIAEGTPTIFPGWVEEEELPYYYSLGDIFCLPTFGEGMPLSILESFSCGTPVLSTKTGSIPDLVDERVGKLIKPRSKNEIKTGLKRLFDENLEKMSKNCREKTLNKYSWKKVVEKTLKLYKKVSNP